MSELMTRKEMSSYNDWFTVQQIVDKFEQCFEQSSQITWTQVTSVVVELFLGSHTLRQDSAKLMSENDLETIHTNHRLHVLKGD
jgi:hypothetical protein